MGADPDPDRTAIRRAAARRGLLPLAIAVVGIALVVLGGEEVSIAGWGVFAVALTVAVALVFLEVGLSEDRARAREEAERARAQDTTPSRRPRLRPRERRRGS